MAYMEWSDNYLTGIDAIDADHQVLFRLVNELHARMDAGLDEATVGDALDTLIEYVDIHFRREEDLMQDCNYPDRVAHARQHRDLSKTVHSLKTLFDDDPHELESECIMDFLCDWLSDHILETDMAYVSHVSAWNREDNEDTAPAS